MPIILASASPARLALLKQIKISPNQVIPADIDEREKKKELPDKLAFRLAYEKAIKVAENFIEAVIIAADTVAVAGRKTLPKALNREDIRFCMNKLSGRRHRVHTGVCIIKKTKDQTLIRRKLVLSIVQFKRLNSAEIEFYSNLEEGLNKAGGYTIQGYAESFVSFISGSYSNIKGLPLLETRNILNSLGIFPQENS